MLTAIAYGMRSLAFRLPAEIVPDALEDGGTRDKGLGQDWVAFHPWPPGVPTAETDARLKRWCEVARRHALAP